MAGSRWYGGTTVAAACSCGMPGFPGMEIPGWTSGSEVLTGWKPVLRVNQPWLEAGGTVEPP
ncbi:MAG: hypothetical protein AAFR61_32005 [Bacteroidota bacterium]